MEKRTREELIDALRAKLVELAGDERSICRVARERNLFCGGFGRWKLHELRELHPQITRSRPRLTRAELEDLADRWQLARQLACDEVLACDVQQHETLHPTCRGWDEFTDEELEGFHRELCEQPAGGGEVRHDERSAAR